MDDMMPSHNPPPALQGAARERLPAPVIKTRTRGRKVDIDVDQPETQRRIAATFASSELAFYQRLLSDLINTGHDASVPADQIFNERLAMVHGIAPRDEMEAILAVQFTTTHIAAMRALRNLSNSDAIPQQDSNGNLANKLLRTCTMQLEALTRYRNAGKQQIVVNHVHVNASQAVVGVDMSGGGGVGPEN